MMAFVEQPSLLSKGIYVSVGVALIAFFGACLLFSLVQLLNFRPGLVIDAEGIIDNASGLSAGRIPWSEVLGIGVHGVMSEQFLIVLVTDPEKYASRGGPIRRWFNRANWTMTGSPIFISSHSLRIDFPRLQAILQDRFARYSRVLRQAEVRAPAGAYDDDFTGDSPTGLRSNHPGPEG